MGDSFDETQINGRFIKKKTVRSIVFYSSTSIFGIIVNFLGNVILARVLAPAIFGAFGVITFAVQQVPVLVYDLGLPEALVQKKKPLKKREIATVFTVNTLTALFFVSLIFVLAPFMARYYAIDTRGPWLFRIFSLVILGFLLESIPMALLRRRIAFEKIAFLSLVGVLSFNLIAVTLALLNLGILSLILAVLLSRIVALSVLFKLQTWKISFAIETEKLKELLKFGLPLRGTTWVGLTTLSIVPLLVGSISGLEAVGYFNFSSRILSLVLVIPGVLSAVLFSSLSRSQDKPKLFQGMVEKSIEWVTLLVFPMVSIFIALGPQIISLIFTDKWLPALWIFSLGFLTVAVSCVGGVLSQALFSLGKTKAMLKISSLRAVAEWSLSLPLIFLIGFNGVALAKLLASFTSFLPLVVLRKQIKLKISDKIFPYFLAALTSGLVLKLLVPYTVRGIVTLICLAGGGFLLYLLILLPFKGKILWQDCQKIKDSLFRQ